MREFHATPPDVALAELAGRQFGVVSLAQLRSLGLERSGVTRRVQSGRLHRVHRGVYAVGHTRLAREGRYLAAVLACGPGAALSHVSAAVHWNLLQSAKALIDVTAATRRARAQGIRLHRSRSLIAQDITTVRGIPTTTVSRTLLDVAATLKPHRLERALAQAERLQLYDRRALLDVVGRANGHRGKAALTEALSRGEPAFTRSDLESWFLDIVRAADLPQPQANFSLAALDHQPLEVDFCWPTHHLIVELDGWAAHKTRDAFRRDRARDAALTTAGWRVIRLTGTEDPATVRHHLQALMHH